MSLHVEAAKPHEFGWLIARAQCVLTTSARAIKAVGGTGEIHGMVAYDMWTPNSAQAHMAVSHPLVWRALVVPAFRYPFVDSGRGILLGIIPDDNRQSLAMTRHLGFTETHRVKDGWTKNIDMVVFEMRREDCRWLKDSRKAA